MAFDWMSGAGAGAAGGLLPGIGAGFLGGAMKGRGGKDAGMDQGYADIVKMLQQYLGPYAQLGQSTIPNLQEQYGQLMNDPSGMLAKFGAGYKQSPGYQFRQHEGEQAALNANAAGGMAGSPQHQQQAAQISEDIANQDYNDYLNQVLGMYGTGLGGQQGLAGMGFKGSMGLGEDIASVMSQKMMAQFLQKQAKSQQDADWYNNLFGMIGNVGKSIGTIAGAGGFF